MDIVIVAQYLRDIENLDGNNSRFVYISKMLAKNNKNKVEIVTSDFMHGPKRHARDIDQPLNYKIVAINEPGYSKNICMKRFYSHAILAKNIKKYLNSRNKPDCIYCAIPSLDVAKVVSTYCKKNHIRFIIDIQDLWPEAFKMVFHVPILSDILFAPMTYRANKIYAQADEIIAVSDTYCARALKVNSKCQEAHTIFLGTKLETFDENTKCKNTFTKSEDDFWIGYCGTLGHSYDLTTVFDALDLLKGKLENVPRFIIMGDGPKKGIFQNYAREKQIKCLFTGSLRYDEMCSVLNKCDIVVNPILHGAAQSIINKHSDYAASGLPVVSTQECAEYRNLVDKYQMGYNCINGNAQDLADKIYKLVIDEKLRLTMGKNARCCAEEKFDRKNTYSKIYDLIVNPGRVR